MNDQGVVRSELGRGLQGLSAHLNLLIQTPDLHKGLSESQASDNGVRMENVPQCLQSGDLIFQEKKKRVGHFVLTCVRSV